MPHKDPEERRRYLKEYDARRNRTPERKQAAAAYQMRYRKRSPEWQATERATRLKRMYGLTIPQWEAMLVAQAGRCMICNDPMDNPQVDHDHTSGAVRDFLCGPCNKMLGKARESPHVLREAANYLERHHPERYEH